MEVLSSGACAWSGLATKVVAHGNIGRDVGFSAKYVAQEVVAYSEKNTRYWGWFGDVVEVLCCQALVLWTLEDPAELSSVKGIKAVKKGLREASGMKL